MGNIIDELMDEVTVVKLERKFNVKHLERIGMICGDCGRNFYSDKQGKLFHVCGDLNEE